VLKTFSEQTDGWKNRNLFQKQWVQMDFKNNTGMAVEEMLMELKSLGERLETNRPTAPYVDVLKHLEAYYEHQHESLKGIEKIQKKQQKNLDRIAMWKSDVKALIEALNG